MSRTFNNVRIQLRNDTAANWQNSTVVLLPGEFAVENDTGLFKIGNGTDVFKDLKYANKAGETSQELENLKAQIGDIPEGKTIIEMIEAANTSAIELNTRVTKNEEDIATLNEDKSLIDTLEHRATLHRVEIGNVPAGTLVNYGQDEVRVMVPSDTVWTANRENKYYMSAKLFAPSNAKYFRESLAQDITDETYYEFENYEFSGIDEHGCKYSLVWLPMAEQSGETWTYTGSLSAMDKGFIGWYWHANWYDENKNLIGSDIIRINLSNESCHNFEQPYYMIKYATKDSVKNPLNVSGATAGQIVKIKTVDANGSPTEWEAIDIPSGSGLSGVESVNGQTGVVNIAASDLITPSSAANKVSIAEDGTLEVNALTFDKIMQSEGDEIILSGGGA